MTDPIIHIGYHKTATSWFQKNFYPHVRNAIYLERQRVRDAFLNTTAFIFDPEQARESLQVDGRPILCEEDLCGHYDNGGLLESLSKDLAFRIQAVYPDAQIVIFIRNQVDMIRSTYLQYVRGGGTYSLKRFISPYGRGSIYRKRWYKNPLLTLDHFAYQHLIHHYQSLFGPSRVQVFCYEDFAADTVGFARRFARHFDLDVPLDRLSYARRNESLGLVSLQLARLMGPFSRWDNPNRLILLPVIPMGLHKAGLKAFNKTPLAGPRLSNERLFGDRLCRELHDRFAPDNQRLARELNLPLAELAYPIQTASYRSV
jgi:hypothetical protein